MYYGAHALVLPEYILHMRLLLMASHFLKETIMLSNPAL